MTFDDFEFYYISNMKKERKSNKILVKKLILNYTKNTIKIEELLFPEKSFERLKKDIDDDKLVYMREPDDNIIRDKFRDKLTKREILV